MAKKQANMRYKEAAEPPVTVTTEPALDPLDHFAKFVEDAERLFGACKVRVLSVEVAK